MLAFAADAAPNGVSIAFSSGSGVGEVSADPDAITRAAWNLLDNAAKYSGASRDVTVDDERRLGRARFGGFDWCDDSL